MIGREFVKWLRLLQGRSESIKTRFELNKDGQLVEHVIVETHDRQSDPKPLKPPRANGRPLG
jgi:hypothetical protein